jgi:hypothetical protein
MGFPSKMDGTGSSYSETGILKNLTTIGMAQTETKNVTDRTDHLHMI